MERRAMDTPATAMAVLLGVVLIGGGALGLYYSPEDRPEGTYMVTWGEAADASATATASLQGAPASTDAEAGVAQSDVARVHVQVDACDDAAADVAAADLRWTLVEQRDTGDGIQEQTLDAQDFTCADAPAEGWSVEVSPTRDSITIEAPTLEEAAAEARSLGGNVTATYVLTLESARSGLPALPIPGQPSTLDATVTMTIYEWSPPTVAEAQEVLR